MLQSQEIKDFAVAFAAAQAQTKRALKDSANPFFKSKYADLASVWDACQEALNGNGIGVLQSMVTENEKLFLVTTLLHSSGQWARSFSPILIPDVITEKVNAQKTETIRTTKKNDPQALGSSISYMRRYSLAAIVGVVQEDDDGERAQGRQPQATAPITTIKAEQVSMLDQLIGNDDVYRAQLMDYLKRMKIYSLSEIPTPMFDRVMAGAKKNWESKNQPQEVVM